MCLATRAVLALICNLSLPQNTEVHKLFSSLSRLLEVSTLFLGAAEYDGKSRLIGDIYMTCQEHSLTNDLQWNTEEGCLNCETEHSWWVGGCVWWGDGAVNHQSNLTSKPVN